MSTRTMEVSPGSVIDRIILRAIEEAGDDTVGFDFNGVTVTVDRNSDPDATYRKWRDTMDVNCKRLIAEKDRQDRPEGYWTSEKPTKPGWYWFRCPAGGMRPGMCEVCLYDGEGPYFYYNGDSMDLSVGIQFAGPVREPQ